MQRKENSINKSSNNSLKWPFWKNFFKINAKKPNINILLMSCLHFCVIFEAIL